VKNAVIVLVPAHSGAGAERLGDAGHSRQRAQGEFKGARQISWAVFLGQGESLFFSQAEFVVSAS
jgi:hypothetical protein